MPRIILITGGAKGIGAAISKKFLTNNDLVYINYYESEKEALELSKAFSNAKIIKADVSNELEVEKMLETIKKENGKLDILINNAGIAIDTIFAAKTKANFQKILDVNLLGPFLTSKYASKIISKDGTIINISSTNGIDTYYPYSMDYDASKAGLISLTHNLAVELAPIRVNTIAPGWIDTAMNKDMDSTYKKNEINKILLKRFGTPEEVASVVFFLASKEASFINNSIIRVDGGSK